MNLDTGNRSLLGMVSVSFLALLPVSVGGCVLLLLMVQQISLDGLGAITTGEFDLLPALVLMLFYGVGVTLGLRSLGTQLISSRRLNRRVRSLTLPTSPNLTSAAKRSNLSERVKLVEADEPFSFTYGLITPRVAVSRGLIEATSRDELDAVLEHERYHVCNLDPLKVVLARVIPQAFFFLPVLRSLKKRYIAGRELAADRRALEACDRTSLAGALHKAVRGPGWAEMKLAAAIGGSDLLDVRVAQLEAGSEPKVARVSRTAIFLSALSFGVLSLAIVASVVSNASALVEMKSMTAGMSFEPLYFALRLASITALVVAIWLAYCWVSIRARR